jgi:hypothetical protein
MADSKNAASSFGCKDAVCIDANKIYDSCCDKDCLEDIRVYFSEEDQAIIDNAISIKCTNATVLSVYTDVEPVTFNQGYYTIDTNFFFEVDVDVYTNPITAPTSMTGICAFSKKCILYGSKGNVKTYTSQMVLGDNDNLIQASNNMPTATVQVVDPIVLSARLIDKCDYSECCCCIPEPILSKFGGRVSTDAQRAAFVTLGLFTILQLSRNVQLLIPVFDFCTPNKECNCNTDSPCEVFSKIDFPTDEFFPPENCDCGCNDG